MSMYEFIHAAYLTDSEIRGLYERMEREGLLDSFFHAGQIKSADGFLAYARDTGTWLFQAERHGEVVAFGMLDSFSAESAYFHHCHFRAGWKHTLETACHTLEWLRTACPSVKTLIGITPKANRLAARYASRCGFRILGEIPRSLYDRDGNVQDAVLSVYTWGNE